LKEHGVPTGIEYLWQLLHTSDDELGVAIASKNQDATFIRKGESKASFKLGALLGAGSQGVVYSTVGESKNFVVKTGKTTSIKRELKALQILQASSQAPDEREGRQYIPVIKDLGRVHYAIRSIVQDTPAFLIEPKGKPARSHLFNVDFDKRGAELIQLWKHVHAGLSYAHKKGIFHLDVSPSNIIYDGKQFLIIDWGSAAMAGERVWGLRGSRLYAHEDVHNNARREWAPKPIYDFVPLYYTLCTLKKGNRVPWKGFNIFYIPCEAYENRNKDTYKTLMDLVAIDASAFSSHLAPQTGTIKEMKLALRKELYIDHWLSDSDYRSSSDSTARSNGDSRDCLSSDSDDSSSD
jgi:serine/threonine protein kinase